MQRLDIRKDCEHVTFLNSGFRCKEFDISSTLLIYLGIILV